MSNIEYDSLYKDFNGVVCVVSKDDRILYANQKYVSLLGYTQDEVVDKDIFDSINPEDRTEFTNNILSTTKRTQMTIRFYHKTGSHLYFSLQAYDFVDKYMLIGDLLQRNYMSFNFDILKEQGLDVYSDLEFDADDISEIIDDNFQALRIALDNLPIDFWVKDKNHRYLYMNEIMLKRTNIQGTEYLKKNDFELFDKHVANDFVTSDLEAIKARKKMQYTFEAKNARFVKWTEVSKVPLYNNKGEFIGLIGCAIDITDLKNTETHLLYENKVLMDVLCTMFDFVITIDPDGTVSQSYCKTIHHLNKAKGKQYKDVFNDQSFNSFIEAAYKQVESQTKLRYSNMEYNVTIKPVKLEEHITKVVVYGKKVNHI